MEKNLTQPSETIANITQLLRAMPEGDRVRVLRFVEAITAQRQGKRQQRSQRRVKAIADS